MCCCCWFSVALHHGAVGWSAVYVIVVFPDYTHLLFMSVEFVNITVQEDKQAM